jgi:hypothetical protein
MSGRGRNAAPVVVREYRHSRDECVRALELLLKKSVSNMAAERAPEPDSRNDAAIVRNTEEVSHVEQRLDRPSEIVVTYSRKSRNQ